MICIESFGIVEQERWCSTPLEEIFSVASTWANVEKADNLHRRYREAVTALDQGEESSLQPGGSQQVRFSVRRSRYARSRIVDPLRRDWKERGEKNDQNRNRSRNSHVGLPWLKIETVAAVSNSCQVVSDPRDHSAQSCYSSTACSIVYPPPGI